MVNKSISFMVANRHDGYQSERMQIAQWRVSNERIDLPEAWLDPECWSQCAKPGVIEQPDHFDAHGYGFPFSGINRQDIKKDTNQHDAMKDQLTKCRLTRRTVFEIYNLRASKSAALVTGMQANHTELHNIIYGSRQCGPGANLHVAYRGNNAL